MHVQVTKLVFAIAIALCACGKDKDADHTKATDSDKEPASISAEDLEAACTNLGKALGPKRGPKEEARCRDQMPKILARLPGTKGRAYVDCLKSAADEAAVIASCMPILR